jgi:hypothetical protein
MTTEFKRLGAGCHIGSRDHHVTDTCGASPGDHLRTIAIETVVGQVGPDIYELQAHGMLASVMFK